MNKRKQVEQKIRELVPELMELSFGCKVEVPEGYGITDPVSTIVFADDYRDEYCVAEHSFFPMLDKASLKIIGHDITLEHVMKAFESCNYDWLGADYEDEVRDLFLYWRLTKPLSQQRNKVIDLLFNLLGL